MNENRKEKMGVAERGALALYTLMNVGVWGIDATFGRAIEEGLERFLKGSVNVGKIQRK